MEGEDLHGPLTRECSGRLEPKRKDAKFQTDQQGTRGKGREGTKKRGKGKERPRAQSCWPLSARQILKGRGKEGRRKHKGETQGQLLVSTTTTTGGRGKEGACVSSPCPSSLTQTLTYTRHACVVSLLRCFRENFARALFGFSRILVARVFEFLF